MAAPDGLGTLLPIETDAGLEATMARHETYERRLRDSSYCPRPKDDMWLSRWLMKSGPGCTDKGRPETTNGQGRINTH